MSQHFHFKTILVAAAAVALVGGAWQAVAQQDGGDQRAEQQARQQMMQCPMMSTMKGLKLQADSPSVILAMAGQLELTQEQKQRLEELIEDVGTSARKILTDDQQQKLAKAPEGPLSMMQVMMLLRTGDAQQGQMCPMCMKMMRERMENAPAAQGEGEDEHAEHHANGEHR